MTAFLRSVYPSLGEESRYIHLGLTTSDVWDTATSLQMVDAADLLAVDLEPSTERRRDQGQRSTKTPS